MIVIIEYRFQTPNTCLECDGEEGEMVRRNYISGNNYNICYKIWHMIEIFCKSKVSECIDSST